MEFLSYNSDFFRNELLKAETLPTTQDRLYLARQLLRMSDDLSEEGYTELNERLEKEFRGISRLREYLKRNHIKPFAPVGNPSDPSALPYSAEETELSKAILLAVGSANESAEVLSLPFTDRLRRFCHWIGYDGKTAYIFLLRDTLLPFAYYLGLGRERIYPWLLSRSSFAALTGCKNADDEIRASVYRALEAGHTDLRSFLGSVLPDMRRTISAYPRAENTLRSMLENIDAERIFVVESGCSGTFPLLLMSLDDRVNMRMYTTYPYLVSIFGENVYTPSYKDNRMFETMASQNLYFRFSGFRDGRFYVKTCTDPKIKEQALKEIKTMLKTVGESSPG